MLRATFTGFAQQSETFTQGRIDVVDTGSQPCALQGTPSLVFHDAYGRSVPVEIDPGNYDGQPPLRVILGRPTPATGAYSLVGAFDQDQGKGSICSELPLPPATAVLTLPGQPGSLSVGEILDGGTQGFQQLQVCGGPVSVLSFEPLAATG